MLLTVGVLASLIRREACDCMGSRLSILHLTGPVSAQTEIGYWQLPSDGGRFRYLWLIRLQTAYDN